MKPCVVVMLKEPQPGRVKTRLGREIGMPEAAWWFRHQTGRLLRRLDDPRWTLLLAVSPDRAGLASRIWPAHLPRVPQGHGDLGTRMARAFRFSAPGPVCIIGADVPGITPVHIAQAFRALGAADAVLGPATDGGYWLIGLAKTRPLPQRMFERVRWSTQHALEDTRASLQGLRVATLATLRDVDTADDLRMTRGAAHATPTA